MKIYINLLWLELLSDIVFIFYKIKLFIEGVCFWSYLEKVYQLGKVSFSSILVPGGSDDLGISQSYILVFSLLYPALALTRAHSVFMVEKGIWLTFKCDVMSESHKLNTILIFGKMFPLHPHLILSSEENEQRLI